MLGAIIGDMVGSIYEFDPIKTKDFDIYNHNFHMTDDSLLTLGVMKVLLKHYPIKYDKESLFSIQNDLIKEFSNIYLLNKDVKFGYLFKKWAINALNNKAKPYNSYGNGSAMRISPVGYIANNEDELKLLSKTVTEITHNHKEGIKGAEATSMCIYLALHNYNKEEIKDRIIKDYYPNIADLDFNDLVNNYEFDPICQNSVPEAIYCFLISNSLEDTIRNCIAIGGDCDTTGAIAGSIAEAYYNKDKLSKLEEYYINHMIDKDIATFIKKFYKSINIDKFNN